MGLVAVVRGRAREVGVALHVHALYLTGWVIIWLATYQLACWLVAAARREAPLCWIVGPLGISAVHLRAPSRGALLLELALPPVLVTAVCYASLYVIQPGPISGLAPTLAPRLAVVVLTLAVVGGWRVLRALGELRFPVWGEAGVLARVQRSRALGALVHFTPAGRDFLRDRFGATPREFLRTCC
ncbi:MAG TPA: hypothetical protein VIC85_12000 [Ktedonobacterales bacterium]